LKDNFCADVVEEAGAKGVDRYDLPNERASRLPVGSDGLIVNEYWQGNRTPYTDPEARGSIWG
jgi:ribulose kinase